MEAREYKYYRHEDNNLVHSLGAVLIDWLRELDLIEFYLDKSIDNPKQKINIIKVSKRI